jgi:four helix bundle protein
LVIPLLNTTTVDTRDLKERMLRFAVDICALCRSAEHGWPGRRLADQMFRSGTSVAANYHAACRARSRREFIAKLGIVIEEAEETIFWLEFAARADLILPEKSKPLAREANELLAI